MSWEGYAIIALVAIAAIALWSHFRRWNAINEWWQLVFQTCFILALFVLLGMAGSWYSTLPRTTRAVIRGRAGVARLLFWLVVFVTVWQIGVGAFVQSFGLYGIARRPSGFARRLIPLVDDYWTIVERSRSLGRLERVAFFVRHLAFGLSLMLVGATGMLMALGFPTSPLWLYAAGGVIAALLLNPTGSDRRFAARLASAETTPTN